MESLFLPRQSHLLPIFLACAAAAENPRQCVTCHPQEVAAYEQSAMAHALSRATYVPDGGFEHSFSSTKFSIRSHASGPAAGMVQRYERLGESSAQPVAYTIGSGAHAYGFLVQIGNHLFQSPLSYYTNKHVWDVAPGYEQTRDPDFTRPVTRECLLCHSGEPRQIEGTLNSYEMPPVAEEGISCERCHGPSSTHLRHPVPGSIVDPPKLPAAERDSICEQCHLSGEVRIPNPGKTIGDFQPGQRLEDDFTIYVSHRRGANNLKVISHAEQLALSACARNSGDRLWCGTCHDPHVNPAKPAAYFRERCLSCHAAKLEAPHAAAGRDCVSCHMPRLPARDGGHTVFTDHRIVRTPNQKTLLTRDDGLYPWRQPGPALSARNLAIALVATGLEEADAQQVIRGYRMLNRVEKQYPNDPDVLSSLGTVLMRANEPAEALKYFDKVLQLKPNSSLSEVNAAGALVALGKKTEARRDLEKALELDPLLKPAVELLGRVYRELGDTGKATQLDKSYRRAMDIQTTGSPP